MQSKTSPPTSPSAVQSQPPMSSPQGSGQGGGLRLNGRMLARLDQTYLSEFQGYGSSNPQSPINMTTASASSMSEGGDPSSAYRRSRGRSISQMPETLQSNGSMVGASVSRPRSGTVGSRASPQPRTPQPLGSNRASATAASSPQPVAPLSQSFASQMSSLSHGHRAGIKRLHDQNSNTKPTSRSYNAVDPHTAAAIAQWKHYQDQPVVDRLVSRVNHAELLKDLAQEAEAQQRRECPFSPTLSPRTRLGTHAKRKKNVDAAPPPSIRTTKSGLQVVSAPSGTPHMDDDDLTSSLAKKPPPVIPHYMIPIAWEPPAPPFRPPKITKQAKHKKRTVNDLLEWENDRREKLAERIVDLMDDAPPEEEDDDAAVVGVASGAPSRLRSGGPLPPDATFSPRLDRKSMKLIRDMADRRLNIYERTQMEALANATDAKKRIETFQLERARDFRVQDKLFETADNEESSSEEADSSENSDTTAPPTQKSRRKHHQRKSIAAQAARTGQRMLPGGVPFPKLAGPKIGVDWWSNIVRGDTAYRNNALEYF